VSLLEHPTNTESQAGQGGVVGHASVGVLLARTAPNGRIA
jgi:hypothetical protein